MPNELPTAPDHSRSLPSQGRGLEETGSPRADSSARIDPPPGEGFDYQRFMRAVLRRKWLVGLVSALGGASGVLASRLVEPEYSAQATVWVERVEGERGPIRPEQLLRASGWVELLRSYVVLDAAVRNLRLYLEPDSPRDSVVFESFALADRFAAGDYRLTVGPRGDQLTLATAHGVEVQRAAPGDSLGGRVGFKWVPRPASLNPGTTVAFSVRRPRDVARSLGDELRTQTEPGGSFLRVELEAVDANRVAATVNEVVDQFVQVAADLKRAKLTELAEILGEQLTQARRNLEKAEIALESYRVATISLPSETPVVAGLQVTQGPVMSGFFEMKLQRDQLVQDLDAMHRALRQAADSGFAVDAFEAIGAVQRSSEVMIALEELTQKQAELRALRYDYTDEYPPLQRLEEEVRQLETTSLPSILEGLAAELAARQSDLDGRLESVAHELAQIPPRAIQEARLRRDVTVAENLYTTIQQRYEEARLAEASSIPDVRVLDPAIAPQRPVRNWGPRFIMLGLAVGLGLSLVGAILLDRLDRRVQYAKQVTADLGLPLLSIVPHFEGGENGGASTKAAEILESMRGARLNITYAHGTAGPLLVTITSPGPGDGKSFVASNLALAFAEAGHRTLLIDGDVRRGTLHRLFKTSRKPGLTDFLMGRASQDEIVQQTAYDSLYLIGAGTGTAAGPELMGRGSMAQLFTSLRSTSGMSAIIVDSPPLAAGVDAFSLGTYTGNMVIVLRIGLSDRELTEAKLDVLDRLPVRVLGAVLNDVAHGDSDYYYHAYYLRGYEAQHEADEGEHTLLGTSG